jgi:UDP-glucose:(heptosyl)LPS alpha-1,3-glucosyltransferase
MKIGIVIRCCRRTGSSRYVLEIQKYILDKGHELHVFTNNWDPLDPRVKIHKIPTISNVFYVYEASFMTFATLITKFHEMDVWIAQATRYFTPDVAYMQFVYREWARYKKENGYKVTFGDRVLPLIEARNIKKVKKIIAMSNSVKNEIIKNYGIPEEKIKVIYSGVDLSTFNPKNRGIFRDEIRKRHGISNNDIVLLLVGSPFERKGLNYLVSSLPLLKTKNVKLVVIGISIPSDPIEKYEKQAVNLGVGDRFVFAGKRSDVYKYFAAADIFVLPSIYEPFGLVVLEAMASGLPVVVSKVAGAAELIEDGKDGLLLENPRNPEEIAEKINYLLENDSLRKRIDRNARKKAEKYPWKRTAEEMLKVFEEVARK